VRMWATIRCAWHGFPTCHRLKPYQAVIHLDYIDLVSGVPIRRFTILVILACRELSNVAIQKIAQHHKRFVGGD
jgi:hypothetical protein